MEIVTLRSDKSQVTVVYTPQEDGLIKVRASTDGGYYEEKVLTRKQMFQEIDNLVQGVFRVITKLH